MCTPGPPGREHLWHQHLPPISVVFYRNLCYIHKSTALYYGGPLHHPHVFSPRSATVYILSASFQFSSTEGYITHKCLALYYRGPLHHSQVIRPLLRSAAFPASVRSSSTGGYTSPTNVQPTIALYYGVLLHHPQQHSTTEGLSVTYKCSAFNYGGQHSTTEGLYITRRATTLDTSIQPFTTSGLLRYERPKLQLQSLPCDAVAFSVDLPAKVMLISDEISIGFDRDLSY